MTLTTSKLAPSKPTRDLLILATLVVVVAVLSEVARRVDDQTRVLKRMEGHIAASRSDAMVELEREVDNE